MTHIARPDRVPNFDVLRLVLALDVALLHCFAFVNQRNLQVWPHVLPAVPAFVALSALLIADSFSSSRSWSHFAWKRLLRVGPAFIASFVLVWAIYGGSTLWPTFVNYLSAGLVVLPLAKNGVLWSLMVEEVLYALHAFTRILRGLWRPETYILGLVVCSGLMLTDIRVEVWRPVSAGAGFFAGSLLYFTRNRWQSLHWSRPLGAVAVGVGLCLLGQYWISIPVTCGGLVVLAHRLPSIPFEVRDLSYGVYVYHVPLLSVVVRWGWGLMPTLGVVVASSLALAYVSHRLIEAPALKLKNVRLRRALDVPHGNTVGDQRVALVVGGER